MYVHVGHMKRRHLHDFEGESLVLSGNFLLTACGSVAWLVNLSFRRQFQWIKREHNAASMQMSALIVACDVISGLKFLPL